MSITLIKKNKKTEPKSSTSAVSRGTNAKAEFSPNRLRTKASDPTDAIFGTKPDGGVLHHTISEMPHLLIAGTTGSGKSVLLNQILTTQMIHATPNELKLAIIDPKKVEFTRFEDSPYMVANPITNMDDASDFLYYLVIEMKKRYEMMQSVNVKNIVEYNELADEKNIERFPYIELLCDEFSQLMQEHKEVEDYIVQLGQMARACGIHIIIATQTPRAAVITGIIKANIPARICLRVASELESRIILDVGGGEKLSKHGDMLVQLGGGEKMIRAQGGYISNKELDAIFEKLAEEFGKPDFVDYKAIVAKEQGIDEEDSDFGGVPLNQQSEIPQMFRSQSVKQKSFETISPWEIKQKQRANETMNTDQSNKRLPELKADKLRKLDQLLSQNSSANTEEFIKEKSKLTVIETQKSTSPLMQQLMSKGK